MTRPIRARVDLDALRHNYALAQRAAHGARCWAVLKADAYGHGLLPAARALAPVADGIAVIELEGAIALREGGMRLPLLVMEGFYEIEEIAAFALHDLVPVLHSLWQVDALIAAHLPVALPVCVKVDTGMHRLGLTARELPTALARLAASGCASEVTLMTHFADADGTRGIGDQLAAFNRMTDGIDAPRSLANSAALLRYGAMVGGRGDWARPGIMLYGASPCPQLRPAADFGLRPVMTLESRLIAVRQLAVGDRVGYGGTFVAQQPMTVGVVACGYGDGYPRHAPTGTPVLVDGRRTRSLGRVSMDKLCVDLTGMQNFSHGGAAIWPADRGVVTLWGAHPGSGAVLPADEVASAAGTIAYELFCARAGRVTVEYA